MSYPHPAFAPPPPEVLIPLAPIDVALPNSVRPAHMAQAEQHRSRELVTQIQGSAQNLGRIDHRERPGGRGSRIDTTVGSTRAVDRYTGAPTQSYAEYRQKRIATRRDELLNGVAGVPIGTQNNIVNAGINTASQELADLAYNGDTGGIVSQLFAELGVTQGAELAANQAHHGAQLSVVEARRGQAGTANERDAYAAWTVNCPIVNPPAPVAPTQPPPGAPRSAHKQYEADMAQHREDMLHHSGHIAHLNQLRDAREARSRQLRLNNSRAIVAQYRADSTAATAELHQYMYGGLASLLSGEVAAIANPYYEKIDRLSAAVEDTRDTLNAWRFGARTNPGAADEAFRLHEAFGQMDFTLNAAPPDGLSRYDTNRIGFVADENLLKLRFYQRLILGQHPTDQPIPGNPRFNPDRSVTITTDAGDDIVLYDDRSQARWNGTEWDRRNPDGTRWQTLDERQAEANDIRVRNAGRQMSAEDQARLATLETQILIDSPDRSETAPYINRRNMSTADLEAGDRIGFALAEQARDPQMQAEAGWSTKAHAERRENEAQDTLDRIADINDEIAKTQRPNIERQTEINEIVARNMGGFMTDNDKNRIAQLQAEINRDKPGIDATVLKLQGQRGARETELRDTRTALNQARYRQGWLAIVEQTAMPEPPLRDRNGDVIRGIETPNRPVMEPGKIIRWDNMTINGIHGNWRLAPSGMAELDNNDGTFNVYNRDGTFAGTRP